MSSDVLKPPCRGLVEAIEHGQRPSLDIPKRALSNVTFDAEAGFLRLGDKMVTRRLTYKTVKTFARMLNMMLLSKEAIESNEEVTKREAYYVSKNWDAARCNTQQESDDIISDMEALLRVNREALGFIPEEKGGEIAGRLTVIDRNPATGRKMKIRCEDFGTGAYSIPISVEHLEFETEAKFVLAIETAGMFQRLNNHAFWQDYDCILISLGGVPSRACRRFIRKLAEIKGIPVYAFTDGDPFAYGNIYRTLKVGSGNAAHINEHFCVPSASFLGVTPQDIEDYNLPTHPLKAADIVRAKQLLENDPFFQHYLPWQTAVKKMLVMGKRVEQQAFSKHGLNYVLETYLPEKLANAGAFLP